LLWNFKHLVKSRSTGQVRGRRGNVFVDCAGGGLVRERGSGMVSNISCNRETGTRPLFLCMGHRVEFPVIVCQPWSFERQAIIGIGLAEATDMKFYCRHCDQITTGKPYRVISEENGVTLLNMTVCRSCYEQARALGLRSEPISFNRKPSSQRPAWVSTSP
jgi:hypothetical protein